MTERTLFDKADKSSIELEPFPHLVIECALDIDHYHQLLATRPAYPGQATRDNQRLVIPAWMLISLDFYHPMWREFSRLHSSAVITQRVFDLFADCWPEQLPDELPGEPNFGLYNHGNFSSASILTDARLEVISPVIEQPGTHRAGHVDTGNRLFSALYYLRDKDDSSQGGGLELFRYRRGPPKNLDVFELEPATIEVVKTIPYIGNTLVVFPNSPLAIHGAQNRELTSHERAYVFVTAECEHDLF